MPDILIDTAAPEAKMTDGQSDADPENTRVNRGTNEKTDKALEPENRGHSNIDSNTIETTLFLQNHEKISLISSLGPIDTKDLNETASTSSTYSDQRQCRICLLCHETKRKRLISPCRCSGSIKYAHTSCLVRWIDTSSSKRVCPARCEICNYSLPIVSLRDKVLNFLFFLLCIIMAFCAYVSLHYLSLSIRRSNAFRVSNSLIGEDDITMFIATLLFFVAFFLAIFTQYRAETSILYIAVRCWNTNRNWQISEYDWQHDLERQQQLGLALDNPQFTKSTYHNC